MDVSAKMQKGTLAKLKSFAIEGSTDANVGTVKSAPTDEDIGTLARPAPDNEVGTLARSVPDKPSSTP